jgi:hypothetical protein
MRPGPEAATAEKESRRSPGRSPTDSRRSWRAIVSLSATPFYAVALMLGFLLNAYSFAPVHPLAVLRTLVLGLLLAAGLTALLGLALRNLQAGGFVAAVLVGLLVGWGRAISVVAAVLRQGLVVRIGLIVVALVVAAVALWLFWRFVSRPGGWARVTYALNVAGGIFVAVGLFTGLRSGALGIAADDLLTARGPIGQAAAGSPDIYFIMPDEYARPDVLEQVYGIDEAPFLDALRQRGFEIADGYSANYIATPYNLMSMFHMRHVPDIAAMEPVLAGDVDFGAGVRRAVNHNEAFDLLRQHGYQIVTVAPPWEDVALRSADVYIDNGGINEFETSLVTRSALDPVVRNVLPDALFQQERDRVSFAFDQVGQLAEEARADSQVAGAHPRFVFIHLVVPHLPVVFGPEGEPVRMPYGQFFWVESAVQRGITRDEFVAAYKGQLEYLNTLIPPAIDTIVAHDPSAVIVFMGDEGSGVGMNWDDVPNSDLAERFATMFSARTPGKTGVFAQAKTIVNVMPLLFNAYLGEQLPLQPDLHYAWRDKETDLYPWEGTPGPS